MIGILKQGLKIAPPEASCSGWSLGKVSRLGPFKSVTLKKCVATHDDVNSLSLQLNMHCGLSV